MRLELRRGSETSEGSCATSGDVACCCGGDGERFATLAGAAGERRRQTPPYSAHAPSHAGHVPLGLQNGGAGTFVRSRFRLT